MTDERQRLINLIIEGMQTTNTLLAQWLPLLLNPEYDWEPELRNQGFYIVVSGLRDNVVGAIKWQTEIAKIAAAEATPHALYYADLSTKFSDAITELLSMFSYEELVYLHEMRNQTIHGQLGSFHREHIQFKVIKNGAVSQESLSKDKYWEIIRNFRAGRLEHDVTDELRQRFMHTPSLFWEIHGSLRGMDLWPILTADIMGDNAQPPKAFIGWENDSYLDTVAWRKANGPPLVAIASARTDPETRPPKTKDVVFS